MNKTALALEGGSLRCMFTAGVTDIMLENGIEFNSVYGVSAGAMTGMNYVSKQNGRTARVNLEYINDKRYMSVGNLVKYRSIFNFDFLLGDICEELIPFDLKAFYESPTEFVAVATDCRTGEPVYLKKSECDDMYAAIRASSSMPLLAPTVEVEDHTCLDGGTSLSIPYKKPLEEGFDKVVVITTREHGYRKPATSRSMAKLYVKYYKQYPELVKKLIDLPRRYARELDELDRLEAQGKIFVLRPQKPVEVSRTERNTGKLEALYMEGRRVGAERLESLTEYLNK